MIGWFGSLRHLRKSGFKQPELVKVYTAMIRPVAEYCSCVFHTLITEDESKRLDHFKSLCLKKYLWPETKLPGYAEKG